MDIPGTMKGFLLTGHGGPEKLVWREDIAVPVPGAGEVLIRVGASSVNNTDINTRVGWYAKSVRGDTADAAGDADAANDLDGGWGGTALSFPRIQGADCCGEIVAVGEGVDGARIGARVLTRTMRVPEGGGAYETTTMGSESDGAFAEYCTAPSKDALTVVSRLTDAELATFPCAYSTAEGMIQRAGLGAERVVITGASGGVGVAAIQLAKRRGAHVTAISAPAKADALRRLGADAVIGRDAAVPAGGFDVILDLVGGPGWPRLIAGLRPGGRYAVAGAIAGPIVELDLRTLYLRDLSFLGCTHQPDRIFEDLVAHIEAGEIAPVIAASYDLPDLAAAQAAFLSKTHVGKIAVQVAGRV